MKHTIMVLMVVLSVCTLLAVFVIMDEGRKNNREDRSMMVVGNVVKCGEIRNLCSEDCAEENESLDLCMFQCRTLYDDCIETVDRASRFNYIGRVVGG